MPKVAGGKTGIMLLPDSHARFKAQMKALRMSIARPEPFLTIVGYAMWDETEEAFRTESHPGKHTGDWEELADSTITARTSGTKEGNPLQMLRDEGDLRKSRGIQKGLMGTIPYVAMGFADEKILYHQMAGKSVTTRNENNMPCRKLLPEFWTARMVRVVTAAFAAQIRLGTRGWALE